MASIYAQANCWEEEASLMEQMEQHGVKKIPERSEIEVDGHVHSFDGNDRSHPRSDDICVELQRLVDELKAIGCQPNAGHIAIGRDQQPYICSHSEKLAICYGLISTSPGTPLLVTKNLRVCLDW